MERIVLVNCVAVLLFAILGRVVSNHYGFLELRKASDQKQYSPLYPWKHRQKREPIADDYFDYSDLERQQLSSWIVAMNDASRRIPNRINRESSNNKMSFANERWMDIDLASRSPPFAPRLGRRNSSPFIPRLGRDSNRLFSF
ncbi:hypothetical protein WA026_010392 [Henosepilachna vigintioctopunctata]|uniref:Uncharacterized protein n=1 Tax=Henosepilachna vigintioctopunctata TaxID=420089 RepID=A0AAW1VAZ9_9CUCU